jgi:hypothetical protein
MVNTLKRTNKMAKCEVPALGDIIDLVVSAKGDRQTRKGLLCFVPGCDREHFTFGMCQRHTRQLKKARPEDFKIIKEKAKSSLIICSHEGCKSTAKANQLCIKHYQKAPTVRARNKVNERKRKIEKGVSVIGDFGIPFPIEEQKNCPVDDFLTTSYDNNHYITKTNLRHLSACMGNGLNLMMTRVALNNLAEDGIIKFLLDEGTYNLGIIYSKRMEVTDILLTHSKPEGLLEVPTSWRM